MSSKPRTNIHIYPSAFQGASRILKGTRTVIDAGLADRVLIVARHGPGLSRTQEIDDHRTVVRLPITALRFHKNLLTETIGYLELVCRTLWYSRHLHVTLVNAHSLSVLPAMVALRFFKGAHVVYDAHELETERHHLKGFRKIASKFLEWALMPFVDVIVVVSPSIASWYRRKYPRVAVECVRNMPARRSCNGVDKQLLRSKIGARDSEIVFLYQGLFGTDRGIEKLIGAFERTQNQTVCCAFMGSGPLESMIRDAAARCAKIRFIPAVPPEDVLHYTCGADIGVCLIQPSCLSYYYCLPNKFFECVMAGVPVVVSPCPDMQAIVAQHGNGWVLQGGVNRLTTFLNDLSAEDLETKVRAARVASRSFAWEVDEPLYVAALRRLVDSEYRSARWLARRGPRPAQ